jgi:hypothetical protein
MCHPKGENTSGSCSLEEMNGELEIAVLLTLWQIISSNEKTQGAD